MNSCPKCGGLADIGKPLFRCGNNEAGTLLAPVCLWRQLEASEARAAKLVEALDMVIMSDSWFDAVTIAERSLNEWKRRT